MGKLHDKVAVITGGNSGIGLATARLFAKEGAKVVVFGRNKEKVDFAVSELGHEALGISGDVSSLSDLDYLFSKVKEKYGQIDILIANAGVALVAPLEYADENQFETQVNTNFKGTFFTVQKALPLLKDGSSIVFNTSVVNVKGFPGMSIYAATKAAIRSLTRTFAAELAPRNIRVNSVSPGPVATEILYKSGMTDEQVESTKAQFKEMVPLKRIGESHEIASSMLFFASSESSFITGTELAVDGGVSQL